LFQTFPPIRLPIYVKLSWGLDYPSPFGLEKLHANRKAVASQWFAVRYSGRGAKLSGARCERQPFAQFPAPGAYDPRATRTHIFRKRRFRTGQLAMAVQQDGDLHRDPAFDAMKRKRIPVGIRRHSSSQARGNPRQILYAAAAVLHAVERAVRGAQKLFRRVSVFGKRRNSSANGKRGNFRLGRETFSNP
jgi:hypothetical protein